MNDRFRHIEPRVYRRGECVTFRKTNEEFGGLSNMAPGFPLLVNGLKISTSEVLYQACRFPHLVGVQRMLITERSPMTAKMKSKPYREESRADFEQIKVTVMRWCLRIKLLQNWDRFSRLLMTTGERPIVEESRKDSYWGAQPSDNDALIGGNVMGRLLMEIRAQLRSSHRDALRSPLPPPPIPDFLLLGTPIGVVTDHQPHVATVESSPTHHPPETEESEQEIAVRTFVSHYDYTRQVGSERMKLSDVAQRLLQLCAVADGVDEIELTVRCRPGTQERIASVLRGHSDDSEQDESHENRQLQLFAITRHG